MCFLADSIQYHDTRLEKLRKLSMGFTTFERFFYWAKKKENVIRIKENLCAMWN